MSGEYINAVKDDDFEKCPTWANQQADRLNPLSESPPSSLDEKEKYSI